MKIDNDTIKYIANLAVIEISEDEEKIYSKDLEQILTYAEILDNMDTSNVPEFKNPLDASNRFRKDELTDAINRDLLISNATETEYGMFKVPKVL